MWPLGSATTCLPLAARRTGTMTMVSSPRTTTPPAENSRLRGGRRAAAGSVDIPPERHRVVDRQAPATLGDDARALERGQEAAGRLAAGPGELGDVGLGRGDEDVALRGALLPGLLDELGDHRGHAALDGLEALAG